MKLCPNCREAVNDDAQVCDHCGADQQRGRGAPVSPAPEQETRTVDVSVPETPGSRLLRRMYIVVIVVVVLVIAFNAWMIIQGR